MKQDRAVACFLTDKELQQLRSQYLGRMAASVIETAERPTGYKYAFRLERDTLGRIERVIDRKRVCCRFITFDLSLNAGDETVLLALTGPEETKDTVKSLFNWN